MEADPTSDLARSGVVVANRYRLDTVIGRGGMGSVWSATHLGLGHQIAVKLISREFIRSPDALRRFDAEAKAAARLQSRHVVQVYDNGTLDDGTPYIAMELLSGESLQHRIEQRGRIDLAESVEILAQACKALGRAHTSGIVHRDIKPDNIFLARTPDEDGDVVKVLDFGVAKVALGEGDQGHTGTGMLLGTPLYMSPEQARGLKTVDGRADLYSLGLAAYTMLSGQLAIDGESFGDILLKICAEPLPSLRAVAPWLPPAMEAWFQRTCARDPAARCQSAQEFIDTLRVAAFQGPAVAGTSAAVPPGAQGGLAELPVHPATMAARSVNQSGVNMAITAAGVPRRNTGVVVAGGAIGVLAILAGGLIVALRPHSSDGADGTVAPRSSTVSAGPSSPAATLPIQANVAGSAAPSESPASPVPPRPVVMHPPVPRPGDGAAASAPAARPTSRPTSAAPTPTPVAAPPAASAVALPAAPPATPLVPAAAPTGPPRINLGY